MTIFTGVGGFMAVCEMDDDPVPSSSMDPAPSSVSLAPTSDKRHKLIQKFCNINTEALLMWPSSVWRIRDVYPGSEFSHPGSRITDHDTKISISTHKKQNWFVSSKKYDAGCSSRITDPDADFLPSRILDPRVKKAPNPGSGSATVGIMPLQIRISMERHMHDRFN
jgi:hypothetical protein